MRLLLLFIFSILLNDISYAQFPKDYNNYSKTKVIETKHYRIYYPVAMTREVLKLASMTDSAYDFLTNLYGYKPERKTDILIHDADYANGWAAASINTISLWPTSMEYLFRGTHEWLRDVMSHEFSHIITIRPSYKFFPSLTDIRIGYVSSLDEKNFFKSVSVSIPLSFFPVWFSEGLAQYGSYSFGGDKYDSHRMMMLRSDVLNNSILTINEMSLFSKDARSSERVYNHGFSLVKYIADNYGIEKIKSIIKYSSKLYTSNFPYAFKLAMGVSLDTVYASWKDDLIKSTDSLLDTLNQVDGETIYQTGYYNVMPKFFGNSLYFKSTLNNDYGPLSLMSIDLDTISKFLNSVNDSLELFASVVTKPVNYSYNMFHDTSAVIFSKFGKRGSHLKNLYKAKILDKKTLKIGKAKLIKKEFRMLYSDISQNDSLIAFVANHPGYSGVGYMDSSFKKVHEFKKIDNKYATFYTPKFTNNGKYIAFSYFAGESRNIGIIDVKKDTIYPFIANNKSDERDPFFYKNYLIFSADYNNIFNIYAYDFDGGEFYKITNTATGDFMPIANDSMLFYSKYGKNGYEIVELNDWKLSMEPYNIQNFESHIPFKYSVDRSILQKSEKDYKPYPNSYVISPIIVSDYFGQSRTFKLGLSAFIFDPFSRFLIGGYFTVDALDFAQKTMSRDFGLITEIKTLPWTIYGEYSYNLVSSSVISRNSQNGKIVKDSINYIVNSFALNNRIQINNMYKFHIFGKYTSNSTSNLFGDNEFNYKYYNGISFGAMLAFSSISYRRDMNSNFLGLLWRMKASYNIDELIKKGDAWDVFYVTPSGILRTKNNKFSYPSLNADIKYYRMIPKSNLFKLGIDMKYLTLFNQEVDSFFYTPNSGILGIKSYPLKKDSLNWYYSGTNNLYLKTSVNFPLFSHIDKVFSIIYFDRLFGSFFGEYSLSSDKIFKCDDFKHGLKGIGANLRLETTWSSSTPWIVDFSWSVPFEHGLKISDYKLNFSASYNLDNLDIFNNPLY